MLFDKILNVFKKDDADLSVDEIKQELEGAGIWHEDSGFVSSNLGFGTSRDKAMMFQYGISGRISHSVKDGMYRTSGLMRRIVDLPCNDAVRTGVDFMVPYSDAIEDWMDENDIWNIMSQAMKVARLQGGSVVPLDIDDGETDLSKPVNEKNIKSVKVGTYGPVLSSQRAWPRNYKPSVQPEVYTLQLSDIGAVDMHRSRLLVFQGVYCGQENVDRNQGWYESIVDLIYQPLMNYSADHNAASTMVKDFSQGIFTLGDYRKYMSQNSNDVVQATLRRMQAMDKMRSMINTIVLGPDEDYKRQSTNVQGLDSLIRLAKDFLCANGGIPHNKLFSESPGASLGESGGSQTRDWYDTVADIQRTTLAPNLRKLGKYKSIEMKEDGKVRFRFNPLWQPTAMDKAQIRKLTAEADAIEINSGVLTPEWVRATRYAYGDYDARVTVPEKFLETELSNKAVTGRKDSDDEALKAMILKRINKPSVKAIYDTTDE